MTEKRFTELWNDCSREDKIRMFKDYCSNYGCDDEFFEFDEEFFDLCFANKPMEAARAVCFGDVTWCDPYIKFDGYGNLESLDEYGAESLCDEYIYTIWEHEDIWRDYIQEEPWREDADELLDDLFENEINEGAKQTFIEEHWDEDLTDDDNIRMFRKWYKENNLDEDGKYNLEFDSDTLESLDGCFWTDLDYGLLHDYVNEHYDYGKSLDENADDFQTWYEDATETKIEKA